MFCNKCGTQLPDGAQFCTNCGNRIVPVTQAQPVSVPEQTYASQQVSTPQQTYEQQPVSTPQQTYAQQPVSAQQPTYTQQQNQPVNISQTQPKKKNLGKILGLSIGIPVGVLTLLAILIVVIAVKTVEDDDLDTDDTETISADSSDEDSEDGKTDETDETDEPDDTSATDASASEDDNDSSNDTNADTEPDEQTAAEAVAGKQTVMVYMVGSTLESDDWGLASADIDEMLAAELPEGVNVVLECGGSDTWVNDDIPDGEVSRFYIQNNALVMTDDLGSVSMTESGMLSDFIEYASETFPAEKYTLVLWDHGGGIPVGFGCDLLGDYYDTMCDYEIRNELADAGVHFDAVLFDACSMCTLEMGMALKDYADYMVGAETTVNGTGCYYTGWLEESDGDTLDYCETIVTDYMDVIHDYDLVGSMAVINLGHIEKVYEEYITYINDINDEISGGDYAGYYQARGNCGYFDSNDAIDLVALTNSYQVGNYSNLMNAAISCVSIIESDVSYGHGLMVYSPYESYSEYSAGRESFVELGYDEDITNFYDGFVSRELAYLGQDYVDYYGGDWYQDDFDEEVADAGGEAGEYVLTLSGTDYYYGAYLTDELWNAISTIEENVVIEDDYGYQWLGDDYTYQVDSNGMLALVDPYTWVTLNDCFTTYICLDTYDNEETGDWAQTGVIMATVNGYDAYLYVYFDNDYPTGIITGYYYVDFEDSTAVDETVYTIEDDDIIQLVYVYLNVETGESEYLLAGDEIAGSDLEVNVQETNFDSYTTYGWYSITDVYGNVYESDMVSLGSINALE